jgi:parvulin-like peptidyl-prolyl isomerase
MLPEDGITPPQPKTFEQSRGDLASQLQSEKADEAMRKKAGEVHAKIVEAKKAGKSFTEACEAAGVKAEAYPAYSMMKQPPPGSNTQVREVAAKLAPGDVSEFTPGDAGGVIVHVDQRPVVDEKSFEEQKANFATYTERARTESIFRDWLKERRRAAGLESSKPAVAKAPDSQG